MNTIFVTGATGFIGGHLVEELLSRGNRVKCLIRSSSDTSRLQDDNLDLIEGTLDDPESYRAAIDECDIVFHVAGLTSALCDDEMFKVNAEGTSKLAEVCSLLNNPPKLVVVSSVAAAGPPPNNREVRTEADPPEPISVYGKSKRAGEIELQKRADRLPITVLRPGIVFGPRDRICLEMLKPIYRMRLHIVVGFRTPPLALIHVDDLVQLLILAAEHGETLKADADGAYTPEGYYFASDDSEFPNYWQFGQRWAKALDRSVFVWPLWRWVGRIVALGSESLGRLRGRASFLSVDKVREATVKSWACSSQKAQTQLRFMPAESLDVRIKRTAEWYVQQNML